ncbi:MAG: TlpA disulfide reductase family protein [Candidatus Omnitrophica bacterium]|nr:TlpA disulfide reductase family protein [Candidatus Omnitrophota bacterium]
MIKKVFLMVLPLLLAQNFIFGMETVQSKQDVAAPDFTVVDLKDNKVSLSDFQNKPVLLFFWTTWCPYCRQEMSVLNEKAAQLAKDGVSILPTNVGENAAKVRNFVNSRKINLRVYLDEDTVAAKSFDVLGVPTYVLINSKGIIAFKGHTFPNEYGKMIAK